MKFLVRECGNSHVTHASSRVFAWLVRDVLGLGTRSEDKALPPLAFGCPPELRLGWSAGRSAGTSRGHPAPGRADMVLEYATVSRALGHGLALLLQSIGVVPSVRVRRMNKSKRDVYLLRVSGLRQLRQLAGASGTAAGAQIDRILAGYEEHIKQRGFDRAGPVSLLTVRSVEHSRPTRSSTAWRPTPGRWWPPPGWWSTTASRRTSRRSSRWAGGLGLPLDADAGGGRGERAAEAGAVREDRPALRRRAGGQDAGRLGAGVQAADGRHPRGPGPGADRRAAGRRGEGAGPRPGGDGERPGASTATSWSTATGRTGPWKGRTGWRS